MKLVLFIILLPLILAFILVMGFAMTVAWIFGTPISIKVDGQKVGYLRWFTFTKV